MLQPLVLWEVCIDGKNQACISLLLAIALFLIVRREVLSGMSYGLSLVVVKSLPLIFLPALFVGARKRTVWGVAAMAFPILVYGAFILRSIDVTMPLRVEGSMSTPGNLPYFAAVLLGRNLIAVAERRFSTLGCRRRALLCVRAGSGPIRCGPPLETVALHPGYSVHGPVIHQEISIQPISGMCFFPDLRVRRGSRREVEELDFLGLCNVGARGAAGPKLLVLAPLTSPPARNSMQCWGSGM